MVPNRRKEKYYAKRYSGKSFKDSSTMKKAKLSIREKRKIKREKNKNKIQQKNYKNLELKPGVKGLKTVLGT